MNRFLLWAPFIGIGSLVTGANIETGQSRYTMPVVGVSAEYALTPRLSVASSAAAGALPGGCAGSCPDAGVALDVSALWLVTSPDEAWGVFVGPSVAYTTFGASTAGVGGAVSAGVRRGIGPRLTIRSHAMFAGEVRRTTRAELGLVLTR